MKKLAFDLERYKSLQRQNLEKRISKFSRLYLEIGGRIINDTHTSRVLPGYMPDTKIRVLNSLGNYEFIYCISAKDIQNEKRRKNNKGTLLADFAVQDLENLLKISLKKPKVALTLFNGENRAMIFKEKIENLGFETYLFKEVKSYPDSPEKVLSKEGFGKYRLIESDSNLIVVSAPGGNSGKMGFCISQIYLNNLKGIASGFAKFETLPVWNLPLEHPLNVSYEFATVNTRDDNVIDHFFLQSRNISAVTYNRDLENYSVLRKLFSKIFDRDLYSSPTEMGINMIKEGIVSDGLVKKVSLDEIKRRFSFYKKRASFSPQDYSNFERAKELIKKYNFLRNIF